MGKDRATIAPAGDGKLLADLKVAHDLFELRFAEINNALRSGDLSHAPFPLVGEQARINLEARSSTLQWVLEQLANPNRAG